MKRVKKSQTPHRIHGNGRRGDFVNMIFFFFKEQNKLCFFIYHFRIINTNSASDPEIVPIGLFSGSPTIKINDNHVGVLLIEPNRR